MDSEVVIISHTDAKRIQSILSTLDGRAVEEYEAGRVPSPYTDLLLAALADSQQYYEATTLNELRDLSTRLQSAMYSRPWPGSTITIPHADDELDD